jgi:hypothetical protein
MARCSCGDASDRASLAKGQEEEKAALALFIADGMDAGASGDRDIKGSGLIWEGGMGAHILI